MREKSIERSGFTLIELSIVLVIIGLIVGGVLVGQDLIRAAQVRATISQVEKYNQAINTFFGKYGYLPGDINAQAALQFGFAPRGTGPGQGDGNGVLQGATGCGWVASIGETIAFWVDLSYANGLNVNLIDGSFSQGSTTGFTDASGSQIAEYLPGAKLGNGNYFYVYSNTCGGDPLSNPVNYYGLSAVGAISSGNINGCGACMASTPGLTVKQAFDIDKKMDDGFPASGNVLAQYVDANSFGSSGAGNAPNAATASSATCYDTTSNAYSVSVNGGAGVNCALSFKLQGGD